MNASEFDELARRWVRLIRAYRQSTRTNRRGALDKLDLARAIWQVSPASCAALHQSEGVREVLTQIMTILDEHPQVAVTADESPEHLYQSGPGRTYLPRATSTEEGE